MRHVYSGQMKWKNPLETIADNILNNFWSFFSSFFSFLLLSLEWEKKTVDFSIKFRFLSLWDMASFLLFTRINGGEILFDFCIFVAPCAHTTPRFIHNVWTQCHSSLFAKGITKKISMKKINKRNEIKKTR